MKFRFFRFSGITGALVLSATALADQQTIRLNEAAVAFAEAALHHGSFTADKRTAWRQHHPSKQAENEFIQNHDFEEFGKWHLAIDQKYPPNTKSHYKFPYGDFHTVHRCALLAVKSRAHQYGYREIEAAAERLIELLAASDQPTHSTR